MSRVFVSGGAGVIGRPLVGKLLQLGADVLVADLKAEPKEWPKQVVYWQGDINQMDGERLASFDPDVCFHLAATFERTAEAPGFLEDNFYNNVLLSHALLRALKKCGNLKRVVFASSYLIYDEKSYLFQKPSSPVPLSEESPINPRNLCGMAKLLHERELEFVSKNGGFSTVAARIFRVYGKGSKDVISRWVRALLKGHELELYGKEGFFDYIFADDVAEGLIRLADADHQGVVNLGTGSARSVKEVIEILTKHFPDIRIKEREGQSSLESSQAEMALFQGVTGWKPAVTLEKGIAKIIAYERGSLP